MRLAAPGCDLNVTRYEGNVTDETFTIETTCAFKQGDGRNFAGRGRSFVTANPKAFALLDR